MANMYDQPAQSNILNTYVPIPFEEMLQAGQARQGRYDQTLAALQAQEDAIAKLPYVAGGPEEKYMKTVISDIDTLARQAVNKDLSQGMNRRWLQDQLRNKVDVNLLSTITRNKQAYDEARKAEFELRRSNQYLEGYEQENDPYKRGDFQLGQTYNYLPQAMTDPDKILSEYFTNIPEDAYTYVDKETGQVKNVITKTKGKLLSALENDADTLALNPSMKWMINQYRKNNPNSEGMTDREIITERARQAIKGNRFTYTKSIDAGFVPRDKDKSVDPFAGLGDVSIDVPLPPEDLSKTETSYRKSAEEESKLRDSLREAQDVINSKRSTAEAKLAAQNTIQTINNQLEYKDTIKKQLAEETGANQQKEKDFNKLLDKYSKTVDENILRNVQDQVFKNNSYLSRTKAYDEFTKTPEWDSLYKKLGIYKASKVFYDIYDSSQKYEDNIKKGFKTSDVIPKSYQESVLLFPQFGESQNVGKIENTFTGEWQPSEVYRMLNEQKLNPDTKRIVSVDKQDEDLSSFKKAEKFEAPAASIIPDMKDGQPGWYSYITTTTAGKKGKVDRKQYKMYYDTESQRLGVAADYLKRNDLQKAYIWTRPEIADQFVSQQGNRDVQIYDYSTQRPVTVRIEKTASGKFVLISESGNRSPEYSQQEAVYKLYNDELSSMYKVGGGEGVLNYFKNRIYNKN